MKKIIFNLSNIKLDVKDNSKVYIQNEIWKDIPNYEGIYQASNKGRIKSVDRIVKQKDGSKKTIKGFIRNLYHDKDGYLHIILTKNSKQKKFLVHRLVATAFIPNPNKYPEVNHIDENKTNNCVENLEWCTKDYNVKYSKSTPIVQYDLQGNFIKAWESMNDVERTLNIRTGEISKCCNNKNKTAGGFIWKYKAFISIKRS